MMVNSFSKSRITKLKFTSHYPRKLKSIFSINLLMRHPYYGQQLHWTKSPYWVLCPNKTSLWYYTHNKEPQRTYLLISDS